MKKTANLFFILLLSLAMLPIVSCGKSSRNGWMNGTREIPEKILPQVRTLLRNGETAGVNTSLCITYPYAGAVFPSEIAAPIITWQDAHADSKQWLVTIVFSSQQDSIYALTGKRLWELDKPTWEAIKDSSGMPARPQMQTTI